MHGSEVSVNWGTCDLRGTLNSTTYDGLENKEYIKQVNKQYMATYNKANSVTTTQDYLWLLSCSEIWNNGYINNLQGNAVYGRSLAKEGEQYKYYANINAKPHVENTKIIKKKNDSNYKWRLRSLDYQIDTFDYISERGDAHWGNQRYIYMGIACGFSI